MPVFRSPVQARVLAAVLLHPDEEFSLTDVAARIGSPKGTVFRFVRDLADAAVFTERRTGNQVLFRANRANPAVAPLTDLVAMTFGAVPIVAEEFAPVPGVHEVWIYGSWAARYRGERGAMPKDVDVLVVGTPVRSEVYDAVDRAESRIGYPVHVVVVTADVFESSSEALLREVRSAPRVRVVPPEAVG